MKTQKELSMSIMGRVYTAYALRRVFRSTTLRALLSVGSLAWIFSVVSVLNVIQNMPSITHTSDFYNFSVTALSHTDMTVQISLLLFAGALIWYARDIIRASIFSQSRTQAV